MTNLSEELCRICGIKPLYKVMLNGIMLDITDDKELAECSAFKNGGVIVDIYPDFEQPENFVKLLEIISKKSSVSFCHNGTYFGCSIHYFCTEVFEADIGTIPHNFLNTLLKQHLRNPCKPKLLEQLKQAIRETEWVYE